MTARDSNTTPEHAALAAKIDDRSAVVAIVGLGYVGLPLAGAVHDAGFRVLGYDVDDVKVQALAGGDAYIHHLADVFGALAASDRFEATSDGARLAEADVILLCVPTPLGKHREPDLSFVLGSTELVAEHLRGGQLVVLESTTYPGTTRDEMGPVLAKAGGAAGLTCGRGYFLAYSPEREDPGRRDSSARTIPKVVGGVDPASTELAVAFYGAVVEEVCRVESAEVAEGSKLLENIYRAVNIALVNELKVLFEHMGIDVWQVIEAAKTKPFGFQPFYPGPGLGGHCIPIDPFYLAWKAREVGRTTRFIELAGEINSGMPGHVVDVVAGALNERHRSLCGAKVLVLGIAYKKNIDDIRESPAATIIELLAERGASVAYHDPHIAVFPAMRHHAIELSSVALTSGEIEQHDCVLIVTAHDAVDYELVGRHAPFIVDTRNAMGRVMEPVAKVYRA